MNNQLNSTEYECSGVDLWLNQAPAHGLNGTYGGYLFTNEAVRVVNDHDSSSPLFLFAAFQNLHPPLEVPPEYIQRYDPPLNSTINGMTSFLDDSVGNLTESLRRAGLWENTLIVYTPDNGGYLGSGGENMPLRAGKFSDFAGGVRSAAFVSGGYLPLPMRGGTLRGLMHLCDW